VPTLLSLLAVIGLIAIAVLVIVRFELFCLRDLARRNDQQLRYLTRTGWLVAIVLVIPIGGICYLYYGRPAD
jgi:hypothetical protein